MPSLPRILLAALLPRVSRRARATSRRGVLALAAVAGLCAPGASARAQDLDFLNVAGREEEALKEWETSLPAPDSATLRRMGFCPRVAGAHRRFHWIDMDGDARADLVYSGFVEWCGEPPEGMQTVIYLARGERLSLAFRGDGAIARIWRPVPGQPVSFVLRSSLGDGPDVSRYQYPVPRRDGGSLTFHEAGRFAAGNETRRPERLLARTVPVRVAQGGAALQGRIGQAPGDAVAVLRAGSQGVVLAEAAAPDGRRWWFVAMEPSGGDDGISLPRERPYTLLGWMRASSLAPAPEAAPGARVTDTRPFGTSP